MPERTVRINTVCPRCYSQTGFSIVMSEENGIYFCPKDAGHKFKRDSDGFLELTESW